ncbi:MAG: ABC transporter permease [Eubacteriales bacterium]|nr:ABC transporter permease [Eubacteriales bacterium]MDD3880815.1 ABC transporter permease [Eubacteriales bacterium]MDD4511818.1 ABC transporter permease [Eubacteriales bacterium]
MNDFANMLTSFLYATILAAVPLLYGTLGEIITEKAGHLNLGVEGMMFMGAAFGFMGGYLLNSAIMVFVFAILGGMLGAGIYALLTVTFKANQNVAGLTLTIFGTGLGNFIGTSLTTASVTGSASVSASVGSILKPFTIPLLSDIPYIGKLLFNHSIFTYLALLLAILMSFYLKRTQKGLNLRAVGENPAAADAVGINVSAYKYTHILLGGAICGIGGAYISLVTCAGTWTYNCVSGQGWIAVALVIFAAWSPARAIMGSLVFGAFSVLRLYLPIKIPNAFYAMLPFVVTCIVLVISSIRMKKENNQPASCGVNYFREER